jgi:hypothetical protein
MLRNNNNYNVPVVPLPTPLVVNMPAPKRSTAAHTLTTSTSRTCPTVFSPGELGKYASLMATRMAALGWHNFITSQQHPTSINPNLRHLPHPAAPYLARLSRHGVPAPSASVPWSTARRYQALQRGPHPSASRQYSRFLLEDMWDYVHMGYWTVLPFDAVQHLPHLKLEPSRVVPQRERRPRPIMDYSFNGVNADSLPLAPHHAMQFGATLQRLLQHMVYCNPAFGPPLLMKLDLADGYYRVPLSPEAALELAVVLPPDHTGTNLIGIPLSLPMGWGLARHISVLSPKLALTSPTGYATTPPHCRPIPWNQ